MLYVVDGNKLKCWFAMEICEESSVTLRALISVTDPSVPEMVNSVESSLGNVSIFLLNNNKIDWFVEYGADWLVASKIKDGGVT